MNQFPGCASEEAREQSRDAEGAADGSQKTTKEQYEDVDNNLGTLIATNNGGKTSQELSKATENDKNDNRKTAVNQSEDEIAGQSADENASQTSMKDEVEARDKKHKYPTANVRSRRTKRALMKKKTPFVKKHQIYATQENFTPML